MNFYRFTLSVQDHSPITLDHACEQLLFHLEKGYCIEEEGIQFVYGYCDEPPAFPFITAVEETDYPDIDWEQQWALSDCEYRDALPIQMGPGPGFGDASHPTTRIVLQLMQPHILGSTAIDLGCGSGVLGLCALKWGAQHVYAVDIDPYALEHTQNNAALNGLEELLTLGVPDKITDCDVLLFNMISSEQHLALPTVEGFRGKVFVSGIPIEEKEDYLSLRKSLNSSRQPRWSLMQDMELEGWWGGLFSID